MPSTESVWDYPRPPRVERCALSARVRLADPQFGTVIAEAPPYTCERVLETSHPPCIYFPPSCVNWDWLVKENYHTFCEWKGVASYYRIADHPRCAWSYESPTIAYAMLEGYVAFYPSVFLECFLGDEEVVPQPGGFYGGWITKDISGPFKGDPLVVRW